MRNTIINYDDVLSRLVGETVACTPAEWTHGALTIDCDGTRIDYTLKNDDEPGKAGISDELRGLCEELYVTCTKRGDEWTTATVRFRIDADDVGFDTTFVYAPPAA